MHKQVNNLIVDDDDDMSLGSKNAREKIKQQCGLTKYWFKHFEWQ